MHDQGPRQVPPSDAQRPTLSAENAKPPQSAVPLRALCGESVEPWVPDSKLPPVPKNSINSLIRKILLATPEFPRFYADFILALAPNSREANILRPHYQKILAKVNAMSHDRSCTHIKVTGVRCNSPALRGEQFCYFHQNAHRGVRRPPQSRLHPIAMIEDEESIQYALMEVINALMRNTIDVKRATLIIRALHIAVKNASRVKFGILGSESVKQIPEYAAPTPEDEATAMQCELPAVSAIPYKPVDPANPHFWEHGEEGGRILAREAQARKAAEAKVAATGIHKENVGTAAFGRPASEASANVGAGAFVRPGREATVPPAAPSTAATKKKMPASATAAAPQERKIAAPTGRRG